MQLILDRLERQHDSSQLLKLDPVDIVIFAPHPDDEVIGCAGVIQQALAKGRSVRIVFTTNGDGYPLAVATLLGKPEPELTRDDFARLGATRKDETLAAATILGLDSSALLFLGYPDGLMAKVPAPYNRAAAQADFSKVLRESRPSQVFVTDRADEHPDHRITYQLVREAVTASGYTGELSTFIVHSGGVEWPGHGPLYEKETVGGRTYPAGVSWPPPIRIPLTPGEQDVKLAAMKAHASQWVIDHDYLGRFVKSEEIFWPARSHP
ncbi:MAG TPA: PIG-L deacetylase family protein [Candidatus Dormibacteraeota bacterium]